MNTEQVFTLNGMSTFDEISEAGEWATQKLEALVDHANENAEHWSKYTTLSDDGQYYTGPADLLQSMATQIELAAMASHVMLIQIEAYQAVIGAALEVANAASRLDFESIWDVIRDIEGTDFYQDKERAEKAMLAIPAAIEQMHRVIIEHGNPIIDTMHVSADQIDDDGNVRPEVQANR